MRESTPDFSSMTSDLTLRVRDELLLEQLARLTEVVHDLKAWQQKFWTEISDLGTAIRVVGI